MATPRVTRLTPDHLNPAAVMGDKDDFTKGGDALVLLELFATVVFLCAWTQYFDEQDRIGHGERRSFLLAALGAERVRTVGALLQRIAQDRVLREIESGIRGEQLFCFAARLDQQLDMLG